MSNRFSTFFDNIKSFICFCCFHTSASEASAGSESSMASESSSVSELPIYSTTELANYPSFPLQSSSPTGDGGEGPVTLDMLDDNQPIAPQGSLSSPPRTKLSEIIILDDPKPIGLQGSLPSPPSTNPSPITTPDDPEPIGMQGSFSTAPNTAPSEVIIVDDPRPIGLQGSFTSPPRTNSAQLTKIVGIANMGNTCYMNTVLQSLLGDKSLIEMLRSRFPIDGQNNMKLAIALVIMAEYRKCADILDSGAVAKAFQQKYPWFHIRTQQDAHEFFILFMQLLKEELSQEGENPVIGYYLTLSQTFVCSSCKRPCAPRKETDLGLSVSVLEDKWLPNSAPSSRFWHLETLVLFSLQPEAIDRRCEFCSGITATAEKVISQIPRRLVVQLKRFRADGTKIEIIVKIPPTLSLGRYLPPGADTAAFYRLVTVIRHYDNLARGPHYEADILENDGSWICCDDGDVYQCLTDEQQDTQAYLCFYELQ